LRDLYVTEYGIADLRGKADEDCVIAMAAIADTGAAQALLEEAVRSRKLRTDFRMPEARSRNHAAQVHSTLHAFRAAANPPDYPLGSDFDAVEQRLVRALAWLKRRTGSRRAKLATVWAAVLQRGGDDHEALARMDLSRPRGVGEWLQARLLRLALARTARPAA